MIPVSVACATLATNSHLMAQILHQELLSRTVLLKYEQLCRDMNLIIEPHNIPPFDMRCRKLASAFDI
jgi:hypothetical protein